MPVAQNATKIKTLVITMVAPTGVPSHMIAISIPTVEQTTAIIAEQITTRLKSLKIRIADRAGNIIRAEVSNDPTKRIDKETTIAITTAIRISYALTLAPVAFEKSGSKASAKILL